MLKPAGIKMSLVFAIVAYLSFTGISHPSLAKCRVQSDTTNTNNQTKSIPYKWKSVQMVGGGFVDGVIFHPIAKAIRYCRTDIGGAYRWSDSNKRWEPLMDWVSNKDNNLMGVESIALDPDDSNKLYLACGTYTSSKGPNSILRSSDRGQTFQRTDVPFRMGGNENGRGNGERMAVDPNNSNIIYMGTRLDGLWMSSDAGVNWHKVESFIKPQNLVASNTPGDRYNRNRSVGIVFVLFDKESGKKGQGSKQLYAGVSVREQNSIFCSNDGGLSWNPVAGQPTQFAPTHAVMATDGNIFLSYGTNAGPEAMTNGAVYKLNTHTGQWTDITPVKADPQNQKAFGYAAVAVDAHNPQVIIASTFNRYGKAGGEDMFRTIDGGQTWKPVFTGGGRGKFDNSIAPYVGHTGIHWLFDIEIDPADPDHALFTTGYGGHETFDLTDLDKDKPTIWTNMSPGIEETVALDMVSPTEGPSLISAIGDYGGFVHWDLDKPSPEGNFIKPHFSNTTGVACAAKSPDVIVRVGNGSTQVGGGNIGYSLNGGKSWQHCLKEPGFNSKGGHIAVSADGRTWLWSPENSLIYYTLDRGKNWSPVSGLPNNLKVTADTEDPDIFYAVDVSRQQLFKSMDGGITFTASALNMEDINNTVIDKRQATNQIYATPGKKDDLWLVIVNCLYHSTDGGVTFLKIGDTADIRAFGFGKSKSSKGYPALYLLSARNGINAIYRSDDSARNWVRVNDDEHQWGLILCISGDPKVYGRVYIGTHGRGILYGAPVTAP